VHEAQHHRLQAARVALDENAKGSALSREHGLDRASLDSARFRRIGSIGLDGGTTEGAARIHPAAILSALAKKIACVRDPARSYASG
jgi:hypothetical protein